MDNPPYIQYAKGPCGPVVASDGIDGTTYTCYACSKIMFIRRAHKRKRNGFEHNVRSYFFHKTGSTCRGEGVEHLAAKDAIVVGDHEFVMPCRQCNQQMVIDISGDKSTEVTWRDFRLDVGVKRDDVVIGAIEVLCSHAVDDPKAQALTEGGLAWCEVRARDVLLSTKRVICVRSAISMCDPCTDAKRIQEDRIAQASLEATLERMVQSADKAMKVETYRRTVDAYVSELGVTIPESELDILYSLHDTTLSFDNLKFETVAAIIKKGPTEEHIQQARTRWNLVVAAIKRSVGRAPHEYAQQQINAEIVQLVDNRSPELTETIVQLATTNPENVVEFGKYRGMTLEQISEVDIGYIRWLSMWTGNRDGNHPVQKLHSFGQYKDKARDMLKGRCLMCFNDTFENWRHWCRGCYRDTIFG